MRAEITTAPKIAMMWPERDATQQTAMIAINPGAKPASGFSQILVKFDPRPRAMIAALGRTKTVAAQLIARIISGSNSARKVTMDAVTTLAPTRRPSAIG